MSKLCSIRMAIYIVLAFGSVANASDKVFQFSIPSQRADKALIAYAKTTNINVIYSFDTISQYKSKEVTGVFSANDAITQLLEGTPLTVRNRARGGLIVKIEEPESVKPIEETPSPARHRIEEIVVSAQKREEALVEVPVAITVLTSEQLDRRFRINIQDTSALIPSLTLRKGNTTRNSSIFLRGLGTTSFSVAAEPSISTIVDGVVLARAGQAFTWYDELERIEVLRGPQGTIFGKNSSAGVINITTKRPSRKTSGSVGVSYFDDGEIITKANITGALSGRWAAKLSGYISDYDGPHTNEFNGEHINGHDRRALRGVFDYLGDKVEARVSLEWFDSDDNCCIELTSPAMENKDAVIDRLRSVNHDITSKSVDTSVGGALWLDWDMETYKVTSISAFREWENTEIADRDFSATVDSLFQSDQGNFQLHEFGFQKFRQFSQEFRVNSNESSALKYTFGAFFLDVDAERDFTRDTALCVQTSLMDAVCDATQSRFLFPSARADLTSSFNSYALFGELGNQLNDRLSWSAGLRLTSDEISFTHQRISNKDQQVLVSEFGLGAPGIRNEDFSGSDSQDATNLSGRLGGQYRLSDKVMSYATYAKGFKGPAFDASFSLNEERLGRVDSEQSTSLELGLKGLFYDETLYLALNAFYVKLDGFQTNNIQILNNNITSNFTNVGLVINSGLELDFMAKLSNNLSFYGGGAYLNKADIESDRCREPCETLIEGRLPIAPKWKMVLGGDYKVPLTNLLHLNVGANYWFRSDMFSDNGEDPLERLSATGLLDMHIALSNSTSTHRLSLLLNNVTDEHFAEQIICCAANGTEPLLRYQIPRNADRYLGMEYKYSF